MPYIEFQGAAVDKKILTTHFACDLSACKGACCTVPGGRGAPVRDEELPYLLKAVQAVLPLLSSRHAEVLQRSGPVEGPPGDRTTVCVDNGACVFVMEQNGIAFCSIESLYRRGEFAWPKPVSCHLYPIRIDQTVPERIRYEEVETCRPARERGQQDHTPLLSFVAHAVERAYGPAWLNALRDTTQRRDE
jgi:hypothetical protein